MNVKICFKDLLGVDISKDVTVSKDITVNDQGCFFGPFIWGLTSFMPLPLVRRWHLKQYMPTIMAASSKPAISTDTKTAGEDPEAPFPSVLISNCKETHKHQYINIFRRI